jgi:DNA-binding GntR family transcriptional regulator
VEISFICEARALPEMEECNARVFADKEMKRINREFHELINSATFGRFIWNTVAWNNLLKPVSDFEEKL